MQWTGAHGANTYNPTTWEAEAERDYKFRVKSDLCCPLQARWDPVLTEGEE